MNQKRAYRLPMAKRGPRGSYKKYNEIGSNKEVPKSTLRSWRISDNKDAEHNQKITNILSAEIINETIITEDTINTDSRAHQSFVEKTFNSDDNLSPPENLFVFNDESDLRNKQKAEGKDSKRKDTLKRVIYDNVNVAEILLLCLQIFVKHSLTLIAFIDILKVINFIFGVKWLPETKYMLHQLLNVKLGNIYYHIFCCNCHKYLGKHTEFKNPKQCVCGNLLSSSKVGSFFLEMDVEDQLKKLLSDKTIVNSLDYRFNRRKINENALEDIYDGKIYKRLSQDINLLGDPNNLSYIFNTDGCQTSFHSKITVWPIYIMINELPDHLRKQNMILAGLWVAKTEPEMLCFLAPFVDMANHLSSTGFEWERDNIVVTSKLFPIGCCVDSPCRCAMLNMKQFNGYHGCTYCNHPGVKTSKTSNICKYPVQSPSPTLRTDKSIKKQMLLAYNNDSKYKKKSIEGVWGPSALMNMKHFDLVLGMIVDFMHSCLLGVIRSYTEILLTETGIKNNSGKQNINKFYIGSPSKIEMIDKRLMAMKPPSSSSKAPKSIQERHMWKAADWLNWLLFYSLPCLKHTLPQKYLNNLALFVAAMHIFLQDSIKPAELDITRELLIKFVFDFQECYGTNFMVYNVHLLSHLTDAVENWGPLWSVNTFPFENQNNLLLKMKKCNFRIGQQIINRHLIHRQLNFLQKEDYISARYVEFGNRLSSKRQLKNSIKILNCELVGVAKPYLLNEKESICLSQLGFYAFEEICTYNRIIYKSCRYTNLKYAKGFKNNDSIVKTTNNQYGIISKICKVKSNNSTYIFLFLHELIINDKFLISNDDVQIKHLIPCSLGKLIAITPATIVSPCFLINSKTEFFVSPLTKGLTGKSVN